MAYCVNCGAYIPDGQTGCLACGYDEAAQAREEKKAAAAAAAAAEAKKKDEDLREILERHRREQQEQNRQWAEQEKARREQQASNRQWAEQEYARRQAEKERQAQQYVNQSRTGYQTGSSAAGTGNKALASLSYLSVLFALPYFLTPDDQYAKFHARQGLKLFVFGILADILGGLTGLGWIVTLARFFFMYKGISNAAGGKMEPLPYIGTIGDSK
ncbi:MAG: hypothetical protein IJ179_09565 [Oscillospiraceae bacterium]|nr:hypothetical protein [Oscillospiraceae bacterium]